MNDPTYGVQTVSPMQAATPMEAGVAQSLSIQAKAAIEARYHVALARPRNIDQTRLKVLQACRRTAFAEVAKYAKPVGKEKVVGPSIRFAEEAIRALGNILQETAVIHDDQERRIVRITVTDLESNISFPQDIMLNKTVERRSLRQGQSAKGQRVNSYGEIVFLVEATEDDLANKQAALASKAIRTAALRLLPGDILEEAMAEVTKTLRAQDKQDPTAARKKLVDAFAGIGVTPDMLTQYLGGQPLDAISPADVEELREIFSALKERETTWSAVIEARFPATPGDTAKPTGGRDTRKSRTERLAEKVAPPAPPVEPDPQQATEPAAVELGSDTPLPMG